MNILWYGFELLVNLIQSVILCDFIVKYFKYKDIKFKQAIMSCIFIAVTFITMSIINLYTKYEYYLTAIYVIQMFLFAHFFLNGKKLEKLLVSFSIYCIAAAVSAFTMFIFVDLFDDTIYNTMRQEFNLARLTIILSMNIIFFYITRLVLKFKNINNYNIKSLDWVILITIPVISIIFIFSVVMIAKNKENDNLETMYITVAILSVVILNAIIYIIIKWKDKNNTVLLENTLLKQEKEIQQKHIFHVEELHEEAKLLRHDLKQYSETIHTYSDNIDLNGLSQTNQVPIQKLKKYISEVTDSIKKIDYTEITGNAAVDSLINYKVGVARKNNINVNLSLMYKIQKIPDIDISIVLGNLLDNAIEACMDLKEIYNEKKIDISIYKKKAYVVILVSNTIKESVLENNPNFITTKENKNGHGLGIKSVKNILKKYNGLIDIYEENKMFAMKVMLVEE